MLWEFCHFASTAVARGSTTPLELLTPLILTLVTNLTDGGASGYLAGLWAEVPKKKKKKMEIAVKRLYSHGNGWWLAGQPVYGPSRDLPG